VCKPIGRPTHEPTPPASADRLLGSVSQRLVGHANCPVVGRPVILAGRRPLNVDPTRSIRATRSPRVLRRLSQAGSDRVEPAPPRGRRTITHAQGRGRGAVRHAELGELDRRLRDGRLPADRPGRRGRAPQGQHLDVGDTHRPGDARCTHSLAAVRHPAGDSASRDSNNGCRACVCPMHSGIAGVISRTSGALLLPRVQASVAELRGGVRQRAIRAGPAAATVKSSGDALTPPIHARQRRGERPRASSTAAASTRLRGGTMSEVLLAAAGRRRSPATMSGVPRGPTAAQQADAISTRPADGRRDRRRHASRRTSLQPPAELAQRDTQQGRLALREPRLRRRSPIPTSARAPCGRPA
jgi:hypothetical protein